LHNLTHKLILHEETGEKVIGATTDMETAMKVAKCMAMKEQRIIMIQPL
jgi:energy-coupling factor transporter ATP-binding protein EcfA2